MIPISQPPKKNGFYIARVPYRTTSEYEILHFEDGEWISDCNVQVVNDEVTHWCELLPEQQALIDKIDTMLRNVGATKRGNILNFISNNFILTPRIIF
jgi:hypothetical protein